MITNNDIYFFEVPKESNDTDFNKIVADSDSMETPPAVFKAISEHFGGFNLDVAATQDNLKCKLISNGLSFAWDIDTNRLDRKITGRVWCNPPYSSGPLMWIRKAYQEVHERRNTELAVMLLQFDPSTAAFAEACQLADELHILVGRRVRFIGRFWKEKVCPICKGRGCGHCMQTGKLKALTKNSTSRQPHMLLVFRGNNADS